MNLVNMDCEYENHCGGDVEMTDVADHQLSPHQEFTVAYENLLIEMNRIRKMTVTKSTVTEMMDPTTTAPTARSARLYTCMDYGETFSRRAALTNHIKAHDSGIVCKTCKEPFPSPHTLLIHERKAHFQFRRTVCDLPPFKTNWALKRHHASGHYRCEHSDCSVFLRLCNRRRLETAPVGSQSRGEDPFPKTTGSYCLPDTSQV
jgi:hypothetical protein